MVGEAAPGVNQSRRAPRVPSPSLFMPGPGGRIAPVKDPASVRKAVIPAGGLGTRFLPASKVVPKELLPILDKPMIQYQVEEAAAAGIEDVIVVTSEGKEALERYFARDPALESHLSRSGATGLLDQVRRTWSTAVSPSSARSGLWPGPRGAHRPGRCGGRALRGDAPRRRHMALGERDPADAGSLPGVRRKRRRGGGGAHGGRERLRGR